MLAISTDPVARCRSLESRE